MPANDKTGQPANDNGPCSTPVLASRQRTCSTPVVGTHQQIGGIKPPAVLATAAPANDNGVNAAVHRDSGSDKQISPASARDLSAVPYSYILKEVASALRKSERWLWDWLKKRTHGLVWLLQRRRVVELTKGKAVIETANSTIAYRPYNKPALGPLGDSLDDFAPEAEAITADEAKVTTILDPRAHSGAP